MPNPAPAAVPPPLALATSPHPQRPRPPSPSQRVTRQKLRSECIVSFASGLQRVVAVRPSGTPFAEPVPVILRSPFEPLLQRLGLYWAKTSAPDGTNYSTSGLPHITFERSRTEIGGTRLPLALQIQLNEIDGNQRIVAVPYAVRERIDARFGRFLGLGFALGRRERQSNRSGRAIS